MFQIRFRLWEHALTGAMFWLFQILALVFYWGYSPTSGWAFVSESLRVSANALPQSFQLPFGALVLGSAFLIIVVTGLLLDTTGTALIYDIAVFGWHVHTNRTWIVSLKGEEGTYIRAEVDELLQNYVPQWGLKKLNSFRNSVKKKEYKRKEQLTLQMESFMVASIFNRGQPAIAHYLSSAQHLWRANRSICTVMGVITIEPFLQMGYGIFKKMSSDTFEPNLNSIFQMPFWIALIGACAWIFFLRRGYNRFCYVLFSTYHACSIDKRSNREIEES
jgi:hypothetical protein